MSLSALILALSLAQTSTYDAPEPPDKAVPRVPLYLPQAVYVGSFLNGSLLTPQLRLQWEWNVIRTNHDAFVLYFEGGGGYGVSFPHNLGAAGLDAMTFFYEHTVEAGIAYRAVYENGFAWGFHVGTGPVFYGARIQNAASENFITGWVEGGAQIGLKSGPVVYGLALRYANLYDPPRYSTAGLFVGGVGLAFYAEWRP